MAPGNAGLMSLGRVSPRRARGGWPGCAPGGAATFFVSPKKVAKEKRAGCLVPPLRGGHTALLVSGGMGANSLRSNMRPSSSARHCATRKAKRQFFFGTLRRSPPKHPQNQHRDFGRERSDAPNSPLAVARAEQRKAPRQRPGLRLAFLLATFLWRSKEKWLACRGETRPTKPCAAGRTSRPTPSAKNNKARRSGPCQASKPRFSGTWTAEWS